MLEATSTQPSSSVEYEQVSDDYLKQRQLKKGAAGWIVLAGLGVSYYIISPSLTFGKTTVLSNWHD